ncbi:galactose mutarotase, partial [Pseudobutyrivibrio sp.]
MLYTIENEKIKLTVADHGAEIKSLIRKADGRELMWQADGAFWARTSPVLFPLVGNYYGKKSIYAGKTYEMGQHGFARDMDFTLVSQTADELVFTLKDNEETKEKYPFSFILTLSYKI